MFKRISFLIAVVLLMGQTTFAAGPDAEKILTGNDKPAGAKALADYLKEHPDDAEARFGLGATQFVIAVEHLGQGLHRYGLGDRLSSLGSFIPILRLPVPANPEPEAISYDDARQILQRFVDELAAAEATLAKVNDPEVKLPLRVTDIALDMTGKGEAPVPLKLVLQSIGAMGDNRDLNVVFDLADATWLRGYCHVLMSFCEFALAHDGKEIFDSTAHLFFAKVDSPYPFLNEGKRVFDVGGSFDLIDIISFFHLIRMPVKEPQRMQVVLSHLQTVLKLSGEMWEQVLAETDDDHEWIPSPSQQGELGIAVTDEMVDQWLLAVKEGNEVLNGKRLIPFWRGAGNRGVNLRRVFTEPTAFDLVLWAQGTAAAPYLEEGELTKPEVWRQLQEIFGARFMIFALWFN